MQNDELKDRGHEKADRGLKIAIFGLVLFAGGFLISELFTNKVEFLELLFAFVALIGWIIEIASLFFVGIKATLGIAVAAFKFCWFVVPFPMDIVAGIFGSFGILVLLFIAPGAFTIIEWVRIRHSK